MEPITGGKLWSFNGSGGEPEVVRTQDFRKADACRVSSYLELATKVAQLQYKNRSHVLLFRGQSGDYRNRKNYTSLKPSLLRAAPGKLPSATELLSRFQTLRAAEHILVREYEAVGLAGLKELKRQQIVRWSILQHYEICKTPLLDVTHSLRIAASFASDAAKDSAYVFIVGVPYLSGGITASADVGLQAVRLSSVCPPAAVRPHIQEGYLLGEYPDLGNIEQRDNYLHAEMDFGRRLIAKFVFNPKTFWTDENFPVVKRQALYPSAKDDPLLGVAERVIAELK
ncbi:MAG TPA: FRG domain-containing protein [Pararobbsia sp.]|jgi:hypothetical protein|nr:FRG domain-containing protein [Pararobbsia sp.]